MTWNELCALVLHGSVAELEAAIAKHPEYLHAKDEYGFTALHILMTEERPAAAEALLRAGADVHAVNDTGLTALHLVQDRRVLAVLVRHGAQLEARDQQGQTPLISHAVEQLDTGCVPVMEALLDAGADVNARDHAGKSALDYARIRQEREKIALLVARGADGPTGPFVELYPSSLDLLACTITMRLTRGTEQREVDAAIEIAFEPGVVGVSFVDNDELWFATYSNVGIGPRELRQVVRTDDAIAAARTQRLAAWANPSAEARALRWPGAVMHVAALLPPRDALPLLDHVLGMIGASYQPRQTVLQRKALLLLQVEHFAAALACITDDKLVAPMLEARALAGLSRFDEAVAVIDRLPPTAEISRLKTEWRKPTGLTVGSAVSHVKFGRGTILSIEGTKARIRFADQERTLAVSFLAPA